MQPLNHDNRHERAYRLGRQPWGYMAIIRYARDRHLPYRFNNGTLEVGHRNIVLNTWGFAPYRGLNHPRARKYRLPG